MIEGELKNKLRLSAIGDEYGNYTLSEEEIDEVFAEAKKDIYEPIELLEAQKETPNGMDYAYTYQKIIERLKKWFGDSS